MIGTRRSAAAMAGLGAWVSGTAQAVPIVYTLSGIGSGTVNGVPFTDAAYEIRMVGDTTGVVVGALSVQRNPVTVTIAIQGHGTHSVTEPAFATSTCSFVNEFAGLSKTYVLPTPNHIVSVFLGPFDVCDLRVFAPPRVGSAGGLSTPIDTTGGPVAFTEAAAATWTQAALAMRVAVPTTGPTVTAWLALAVLLAGFGALSRRTVGSGRSSYRAIRRRPTATSARRS